MFTKSLRCVMVLGALTAVLFAATSVKADVMIQPTGVTVSSNQGGVYQAVYMIDNSNLTSPTDYNTPAVVNAGDPVPPTYATHFRNSGLWLSANATQTELGGDYPINTWCIFDLGGLYNLSALDVWQYNQDYQTQRGVMSMSVSVAGSDQVFGSPQSVTLTLLPSSVYN